MPTATKVLKMQNAKVKRLISCDLEIHRLMKDISNEDWMNEWMDEWRKNDKNEWMNKYRQEGMKEMFCYS